MDGVGEPLSLSKAAERLGITQAAVRKRIKRGTLTADKGADGTWTVWVTGEEPAKPAAKDGTGDGTGNREELVAALRDEVAFLRDELKRKDVIISQFAGSMGEVRELVASVPQTTLAMFREQEYQPEDDPEPETEPMPSWWERLRGWLW